jgi:DNA mismatch repair protein MutL
MPEIKLLGQETIDQIAAGEVVERPLSVVKELVENAIDAGAKMITVEIKDGGISFIRVTDNGCGIEKEQLDNAFLRHATSKINTIGDLAHINSLGFRGEALASIAAVSRVEVITKTKEALTGAHYLLTPGEAAELNEIGAPTGTTILVRNLFFNVPVRRKFLKKSGTEGSYITDMMERLALSRPDISLKYTNNGVTRFHTSGAGDLREVIFRLFGKEITQNLVPLYASDSEAGLQIAGYLGLPSVVRSNRDFEFFMVNGRCVTGDVLRNGLEDGYHPFLMSHKFPFAVLVINIDSERVDVNVHPGKLEVRFRDEKEVIDFIGESVKNTLTHYEHILTAEAVNVRRPEPSPRDIPEPFEVERIRKAKEVTGNLLVAEESEYIVAEAPADEDGFSRLFPHEKKEAESHSHITPWHPPKSIIRPDDHIEARQLDLFTEKFMSEEARGKYTVLGQVFETYWLVLMGEQIIFVDQHAAHEKVKYERLVGDLEDKAVISQIINPPIVVELSAREEDVLKLHLESFENLGFEIDDFGDSSYALRSVPAELYGQSGSDFFREVLDEMSELSPRDVQLSVEKRLAQAACKAAVKANMSLTEKEFHALVDELITLENPYFCPHGRPTMITMSKKELEKKFKRS